MGGSGRGRVGSVGGGWLLGVGRVGMAVALPQRERRAGRKAQGRCLGNRSRGIKTSKEIRDVDAPDRFKWIHENGMQIGWGSVENERFEMREKRKTRQGQPHGLSHKNFFASKTRLSCWYDQCCLFYVSLGMKERGTMPGPAHLLF